MPESVSTLVELLDAEKFSELFIEELGWDKPISYEQNITAELLVFKLSPVASFKGIQVWLCNSVPPTRVQREIDRQVSKLSMERLVIYTDGKSQHWRWPMAKESNGRGIVRLVDHEYKLGQRSLALTQRLELIRISLDSPEPSLVEMLIRLRKAFDADQVTKSFYNAFAQQHQELSLDIEGIQDKGDRDWYASLLLNRLMFIYFIQWKGFMNGDRTYLSSRLDKVRAIQGPDKFFFFYRDFLIPLFHHGLGAGKLPEGPQELIDLIGIVPYINGGIFSENSIERTNQIAVPDITFQRIFTFFDQYQWHLDSRPTGNPNEINPDVLGYIFEQFVNNKDQGAYYTKEDVTDYITINSVTAYALEKIILSGSKSVTNILKENPSRYVWQSLSHGSLENLPKEILNTGFEVNGSVRDDKAPDHIGLPGETWWEVIDRRARDRNTRKKIDEAKITMEELIDLNIDLEDLTVDLIDKVDSIEEALRIWLILTSIKIVDPTCGSGAFLFSAMKRLLNLYKATFELIVDINSEIKDEKAQAILEEASSHANFEYFLLKKISRENLFGVDLMREATEIARLRLFLKLISVVDNFADIEPLPDLEFNIKSGNLLVGASTKESLESAQTMEASQIIEKVMLDVKHLEKLLYNFEKAQDSGNSDFAISAKDVLMSGIASIRPTLDQMVFESSVGNSYKDGIEAWRATHQPFHWFLEFPRVFSEGGFNVVIGNPPYIGTPRKKVSYSISGYKTSDCPDLYAICMERSAQLLHKDGHFAMIVMTSMCFSGDFQPLRKVLTERFPMRWISSFGRIPACLFTNETRVRNSIFIGRPGEVKRMMSTRLYRWESAFRPHLMTTVSYQEVPASKDKSEIWPFIASEDVFQAIHSQIGGSLSLFTTPARSANPYKVDGDGKLLDGRNLWALNFKTTAYNYMPVFIDIPPKIDESGEEVPQSKMSTLWFREKENRDLALTLLVGRWGFAWWCIYGDDFDLTGGLLNSFPIDFKSVSKDKKDKLLSLVPQLRKSMIENKTVKKNKGMIYNWYIPGTRKITDQSDSIWAQHISDKEILGPLQFQYYGTVKTSLSADAIEIEE